MIDLEVVKSPVMEVFERWVKAMSDVIPEENCNMSTSSTLVDVPSARIRMLGAPMVDGDLYGNEVSVRPTFEVAIYQSGRYALTDLYTFDETSHDAMVSMGFRRIYGPEMIDNIDESIKRLISRYTRIYTGYLPDEEEAKEDNSDVKAS